MHPGACARKCLSDSQPDAGSTGTDHDPQAAPGVLCMFMHVFLPGGTRMFSAIQRK
jgi:hypothetical protein